MLSAANIVSSEIANEQLGVNKKRHFVAGEVVPKTVNRVHSG